MTPTLRRLNDRERYWGLTWPGWLAAGGAGAVLYAAVKLSPFGLKPTVTIVVLLLGLGVTIGLGVCGQALSPGRHLLAIIAHRRNAKQYALREQPDKHGLLLASAPDPKDLQEPPAVIGAEPFGRGLTDVDVDGAEDEGRSA